MVDLGGTDPRLLADYDAFTLLMFDGGHFFLDEHTKAVALTEKVETTRD